MSWTIQ